MHNKVMVDSSILVEYTKKTKILLLDSLLVDSKVVCYINETIVSEFLFQYIKISTGKASKTTQQSRRIPSVFQGGKGYMLLNLFLYLPSSDELYSLVRDLMTKYNLLPNQTLLFATFKIHGITQLVSHDSDFFNTLHRRRHNAFNRIAY